MKKITLTLLSAAFLATSALAVPPSAVKPSAYFETQNRSVGNFHAIVVSGSMNVYVKQTGSISVKVDADKEIIDRIETTVSGGTLKISLKNSDDWKWWKNMGDKKMDVYVTVKDLDGLKLSGSGDVSVEGEIKSTNMSMNLTGSGNLKGRINAKNLESSLTGSGDLEISGRAETSHVVLTGSGDYTGSNLVTSSTSVRISGSGDASVNATQKLEAHVSGSGDIRYAGSPKQVSKSTSGSGDISRM